MTSLRSILWAVAGAVILPASAFVFLIFLLGAFDVCGPGNANRGCSTVFGLSVLVAAPVGGLLFWTISRAPAVKGERRKPAAPFGRAKREQGKG